MKYSVKLIIDTGRPEEAFDNVDVEDMLGNVLRGMMRQYELESVTLKQKQGIDLFMDRDEGKTN